MTGLYEYRHGCNFEHGDLERRFMEQSYPVRLRQAFPGARITALVGPWGRPMWEGNPDIDRLEVVQFPGIADRELMPATLTAAAPARER